MNAGLIGGHIGLLENEVSLTWLGQAGFIIRDTQRRTIFIDPYLTDCVERIWGFKRLMMPLIAPEEVDADFYVATHGHEDHFDIDAAPAILNNAKTRLICSRSVAEKCEAMGVGAGRIYPLSEGEMVCLDGLTFQAVFADHGKLAPDAIGVWMDAGGVSIYFTGDTAYKPGEILESLGKRKVDILIAPINGEFGNLNSYEAAMLARVLGSRVTVPCHFWTFAAHRGDPLSFMEYMKEIVPGSACKILCQGESFVFNKKVAEQEKL
ncbi:MAG: MBL fold metallo-hydrolase [Eubacteriales bacterium]